jgi:putative oxidoreductase
MSYGILFLRFVLGVTVAAHGGQKLFGSLGGHGPRGTGGFFSTLGFRAAVLMAIAAGTAEFGGGVLLASGLLTPLAALAIAVVMLNAIGSVHWRNGFWNSNGGYEFNLNLWAAAVAIAAIGPGRFSLDALIGWADNISGLWWGVGVAGLSVLVSAVTLTLGRRHEETRETVQPAGEEEGGRRKAA